MKEIILIGGGGHCRSVIDVIEMEGKFKIAGIVDNNLEIGDKILGYEVIGCDDELEKLRKKYDYALVTIGQIKSAEIRIKLFSLLKNLNYNLPVIISPRAYVSKHSFIDEGTVVMHDVLINANAKVGKNCIINSKALIEHDVVIEDNCHISTGATVNGGVVLGKNSFFGSGAIAKEYIKIEENSFIKARSLVK
ncbi:NeuD/PglB/VioB family sugar acetyltransferase [Nitrosophilus labii]|uniref:NeuD/PglB/VioB family sugar acetyltransferase n=1 Tax=Nitrosophilus labii TaxID=2706014 RepID=UPI0016573D57|nr:NeuD/PglB/VioB family sugar acetyltransferase [Nitrosophilus labii]